MRDKKILLDHGSGGKMTNALIADLLLPTFDNPALSAQDDGAILQIDAKKLAFSTDSFVVDPIFFPGGNIGDLAVNGTVNDIAMCGASPLYLSAGLIIEEGFPVKDLKKILTAMKVAADTANVKIVTGDTKVVATGAADKIFINTSGIGVISDQVNISGRNAKPGDKIIVSGTIADHGIAVMIRRENLSFESSVTSDTASLNHMVKRMLIFREGLHVLRDPTRGGVGTALNEIAGQSKVGIEIFENKIPVNDEVSGICEFLGFDPLYVANEGKLVAFVAPEIAEPVLKSIQEDQFGHNACIIGEVVADHPGQVFLKTRIGGSRIVDMLTGEQLPRIC